MQKQNKLGLFWKLCAKKKFFFQESRIADTIMPKVECVRVPVKKKKRSGLSKPIKNGFYLF